jgi:hypothetical protein
MFMNANRLPSALQTGVPAQNLGGSARGVLVPCGNFTSSKPTAHRIVFAVVGRFDAHAGKAQEGGADTLDRGVVLPGDEQHAVFGRTDDGYRRRRGQHDVEDVLGREFVSGHDIVRGRRRRFVGRDRHCEYQKSRTYDSHAGLLAGRTETLVH